GCRQTARAVTTSQPKPIRKPQSSRSRRAVRGVNAMETLLKSIKGVGIGTIALVLIGFIVALIYYLRTDPETTVVAAGGFPANLSPGFTPEQLVDELLAAM